MRAYPLFLTRRGFSMYSSSVRMARSLEVCGVRPVLVKEAAALPLVWMAVWEGGALGLEIEFGFVVTDERDLEVEREEEVFGLDGTCP